MQKALLVFLLFGLATNSSAAPRRQHAELHSVAVKRPNIVVRGAYLGKVEIWAVPTGTEITENEYALVGNAKRNNDAGRNEIWVLPITCTSPLIPSTEVFVKGFDANGNEIGKKSLPYNTLTGIYEALCGAP